MTLEEISEKYHDEIDPSKYVVKNNENDNESNSISGEGNGSFVVTRREEV